MADNINTAEEVMTGKGRIGGYAYIAPSGTALPTDAKAALDEAFKVLGYISEDGVTFSTETDSTEIKDMNGDTVLTVQSSHSVTAQMTFIQALNVNVLKMIYGEENVTDTEGAISVKTTGAEQEMKVFCFEFIANGRAYRKVVPCGKITNIGDTKFSANEAVGYDVTITALPDENGVKVYEYVEEPKKKVE